MTFVWFSAITWVSPGALFKYLQRDPFPLSYSYVQQTLTPGPCKIRATVPQILPRPGKCGCRVLPRTPPQPFQWRGMSDRTKKGHVPATV